MFRKQNLSAMLCATVLVFLVAGIATALPNTISICDCNIHEGGRYTDSDTSTVTYDTASRFATWVAGSGRVISVIGMQEVLSETDRATIELYLEAATGYNWNSVRYPCGINNRSGNAIFWRPDLVTDNGDLGQVTVDTLDNGYELKFAGRLFTKIGYDYQFAVFTGKLIWNDGIIRGHSSTDADRTSEAITLKNWIKNTALANYPNVTRLVCMDMNTGRGSSTFTEMDKEFTETSTDYTFNSLAWLIGPTTKYDYVWWDYDSSMTEQSPAFSSGPHRSSHFGSDHRAVYCWTYLH
jgi:hypothetical protein